MPGDGRAGMLWVERLAEDGSNDMKLLKKRFEGKEV